MATALEYRALLLMSGIYRRWESFRLKSLQPWIRGWRTDELYGGMPGRSAKQAT